MEGDEGRPVGQFFRNEGMGENKSNLGTFSMLLQKGRDNHYGRESSTRRRKYFWVCVLNNKSFHHET